MKRPKSGRPKRTAGRRDQRQVIRVLTEGAVTEPGYLVQWARRNRRIHIDFAESGMAPLSLVQRARDLGATNAKRLEPSNIEALVAGYEAAKARAQQLRKRHLANGSDPTENPSSTVWELVDRFL